MELTTLWFCLIAFLWVGYFVLEGFDFGVGMLVGLLGRNDRERRLVINAIGPVWDGNEVWLIVAAGATFAAFPEWYATLFSGFYLPLLVILVSLILRNVAFDYRGKRTDAVWRRRWDRCIIAGSALPAVLWGIIFGNLVSGVPIDAEGEYVGGLSDLFSPAAALTGLVTLTVFLSHGAVFLALKTDGDLRHRARRFAARSGLVATALATILLVWLNAGRGSAPGWSLVAGWVLAGLAVLGLVAGQLANRAGREGLAFLGSAVAVVAMITNLFVIMFPDVMPSSLDPAWSLTVTNAASTPYTLTIMTWAALIATPVVLAYHGWTYWVFRKRLTLASIPDDQHAH